MKHLKKLNLKQALLAGALISGAANAYAQIDAAKIIESGLVDANYLMQGYTEPFLKSLGVGANNGWYQTAKPHGLGGFDITFSAIGMMIPKSDQSFEITNLKNLNVKPGTSNVTPTAFGSTSDGARLELNQKSPFTGNDTLLAEFTMPGGTGVNYSGFATAQLSVGVGLGTDLMVRFLPEVTLDQYSVSMYGGGFKHDIKQWIPGLKELPFDMSVQFGYIKTKSRVNFTGDNSIQAETGDDIYNPDPGKKYSGQAMELESDAWNTNLILSKKLSVITFYGSVGYQNANTTLNIVGQYPVKVPNNPTDFTNPNSPSAGKAFVITEINNPIALKSELASMRANLGMRLKLSVLTIHFDYNFGEYNVGTAGIGINIQDIKPL